MPFQIRIALIDEVCKENEESNLINFKKRLESVKINIEGLTIIVIEYAMRKQKNNQFL